MRRRRLLFGVLVAAGCASPLTVAETRDASTTAIEGGPLFDPKTPNDGSRDAFDELPSLTDPPEDAADAGDGD